MNFFSIWCVILSLSGMSEQGFINSAADLLLSDCSGYKTALGVDYLQLIQSNNSPDLSIANLHFYTRFYGEWKYSLPEAVDQLLNNPNFDINLPVVIYVHGFFEFPNFPSIKTITQSLLTRGGVNVLHLDSSRLIGFWYMYSTSAVRFIGDALGRELVKFIKGGILHQNIHLIGFSLGAHIAGFAGKEVKKVTGSLISRISALDPAGPCYYKNDANSRIAYSDAEFVDVIHTNSGKWGMIQPVGHADYFPNGGDSQPLSLLPAVSHHKAWAYYAESILFPKNFITVQCDRWKSFKMGHCYYNLRSYMGYGASTSDRGVFYLKTRPFQPYGYREKSVSSNLTNFWFS